MKAVLYKDYSARLCDLPALEPGPGEVVVAVDVCGLCGTDVMKLATRAPSAVLGHELCGRVTKIGAGVTGLNPGDRVTSAHHVPCLSCHYCRHGQESMCRQFKATNVFPGGFAQSVLLSAGHVRHTLLRVPKTVDVLAASQAEPLACCLRNAKRLGLKPADAVAIVGLGAIGQLMARLLSRVFKVSVFGLDLDASRAASLDGFGQGTTRAADLVETTRRHTGGRGLDAVILTAGTTALAEQAVSWLRDGGTLNVFASFHPDPVLRLDLNAVYHRELSVISSYSPSLQDLREALDLIASRRVDVQFADQRVYGLAEFAQAVEDVRARRATKAFIVPLQRVTT